MNGEKTTAIPDLSAVVSEPKQIIEDLKCLANRINETNKQTASNLPHGKYERSGGQVTLSIPKGHFATLTLKLTDKQQEFIDALKEHFDDSISSIKYKEKSGNVEIIIEKAKTLEFLEALKESLKQEKK